MPRSADSTKGIFGCVPRLYFGVPLEDVFSERDVHPTIKKLFLKAYENATSEGAFSVEEIINYLQGSLDDRLALKEKVEGHHSLEDECPPGAFIWVIRHFIGRLPIALFPKYANEKVYEWEKIAEECCVYLKSRKRNSDEVSRIVNAVLMCFSSLSQQNFLMICTFLNFLRSLSVYPRGEPFLDKKSAVCLTRYFVNAVFVRPFRPGYLTEKEKRFAPLLFFLIKHWPSITTTMVKGNFGFSSTRCLCSLIQNLNHYYASRNLAEISTQTEWAYSAQGDLDYLMDSSCQTETNVQTVLSTGRTANSKQDEVDCLMTGSSRRNKSSSRASLPRKHSQEKDFLIDLSAAPSPKKTNTPVRMTKCCCCYGSNYEVVDDGNVKITRRQFCCCMYSTNYESHPQELGKDRSARSTLSDSNTLTLFETENKLVSSTEDSKIEDTLCPILSSSKEKSRRLSSYVHTASFNNKNDEYIYDDYLDQCDFVGSDVGLDLDKKNEDTISENPASTADDILTLRISKIGWSYTNSSKDNSAREKSPSSVIGWNIPKVNYSIYFDTKENLADDDEKDKCEKYSSSMENIISPKENDMGDSQEVSKKKSFANVDKLKSRLNFAKMFDPRRVKLRRTASYEYIDSNVKYEKMIPARSNIF